MEGQTLCWTDIPVIDLDRAITFYTAVLGAPVTKEEGQPGVEFGLLPHDDNASGCLTAVGGDNQPSLVGPLIYLSVDGRLDAAIAAVHANGGQVMQAKHQIGPYGYRAVIVDSEGNRIALHSSTA
jgi:predicted enzyme related to lactoylglutathione lyase